MKLRISYSLLHLWDVGDIDGAISAYFHMDRKTSQAMNDGKRLHKEIQDHIADTNKMPDWFFDFKLKKPENEKEIIVTYNDQFDLKVLIDTYDDGVGYEYKTGISNSITWSRTAQLPIYFLACELAGIPIDRFYLLAWNQYMKEKDFCIVWNSEKIKDYARNYIDSYAPEIYEHFLNEGLI